MAVVKAKPNAAMTRFNQALRKVLTVSHSDMQRMIDEDKKTRKPRARRKQENQ